MKVLYEAFSGNIVSIETTVMVKKHEYFAILDMEFLKYDLQFDQRFFLNR